MCSVSVKYLREHLKNAHKITEQEYMQLFSEDGEGPVTAGDLKNEWEEPESKRRAEDFEEEKRGVELEQEVARLQQVIYLKCFCIETPIEENTFHWFTCYRYMGSKGCRS